MNWAKEVMDRATELAASRSAQQIADVLNKEFGTIYSRSAVIGALDRAGVVFGLGGKFRGDWTPEREQRLRNMAAQGHSLTTIGLALEMSAQAVNGKCKRAGIIVQRRKGDTPPKATAPDKAVLDQQRSIVQRANWARQRAEPTIVEPSAPAPVGGKLLVDLGSSECHFVLHGTAGHTARFCAEATGAIDLVYCAHHAEICTRSEPLHRRRFALPLTGSRFSSEARA